MKFLKSFVKKIVFSIFIELILLLLFYAVYIESLKEKIDISSNSIYDIELKNKELWESETRVETTEKPKIPITVEKPSSGDNLGILKIPSIEIELPMFYGTTGDLLKKGLGIDKTAYLPGEGGSIVSMGHNFYQFLGHLPNAQIGDEIQITTNYGEFSYTVYDKKIIKETEVDKVPIQKEEEILMLYTCWPIPNVTHATQRYVVYAK